MSVLNDENIKEKQIVNSVYELPAVFREDEDDSKFEKALIISIILHPIVVLILLLVSFIFDFLGITFNLLPKPELKPKDIEFVLVEKEAPPINKNTKNRADKNSRAGGKHDPKRPVSLPQAPAAKPEKKAVKKAAQPMEKPAQKPLVQMPKVQRQPEVKPQPQPKVQPQQPVEKVQPKVETPAPKAPAPRPTPAPAPVAPKVPSKPLSDFNIPIPKSNIPQVAQPTAPLTAAPKTGGGSPNGIKTGTGSGVPAPTFSKSTSGGGSVGGTSGGPNGGRFGSTGANGTGRGNVGNPGPGNPNGAPGIDAIKEPDFGPYMKELQRRIKMNWDPPKGNESKRVVLLFTISKDGRLINVNVHRSSGLQAADNAAINAVKLTAPFRPLPPEFKGNSVDIQFTFDYNVLGASMY